MASKYDTALIQIRYSYIGSEDILYHGLPTLKFQKATLLFFQIILMGRYSVYNIGLVFALHQQESVTSTHVFPHPEPSSHLTPQTVVLCCSRALVLGALHHALNLHQLSVYVRSCTCFNAILSNHPTVALSTESKICSFHLCLFCCPACRIIVTISPNCIHMHSYTIF